MNKQHMRTWGSHVPINKTIIEFFKVTGVMELGAGYNSTPMFFQHSPYTVSIETDKEWVDKMKADLTEDENRKLIHQTTLNPATRATRRHMVSQEFLQNAYEFWMSHMDDRLNFLFIDSISSLRYEALTRLYDKFDFITFHDYQPPGITNHYNGGFTPPSGYKAYIDKTYPACTGILIKDSVEFDMDKLKAHHQKNAKEYLNDSNPNIVQWS